MIGCGARLRLSLSTSLPFPTLAHVRALKKQNKTKNMMWVFRSCYIQLLMVIYCLVLVDQKIILL